MPSKKYPNVQPRRDARGVRWRARVQHLGSVRVGPYRATQAEAHADAVQLRAEIERGSNNSTLARALDRVAEDAAERGVTAYTIRHHLQAHARWLRDCWAADVRLDEIDAEEVCRLIREAIKGGRAPATLRSKDLPLLDRAFRIADAPSPVPEAKRRMATMLRGERAPRATMSMAEIAAHLQTIRASGQPCAERHADIYLVLATTGIRAGELARVTADDIEDGRILIRVAKDRAHPRAQPVPAIAAEAIERLQATAAHRRDGLIIPGGMSTLSTMHRRWVKRLGEPRWTARDLRRSYATALAMGGASTGALQAAMGHRNLRTTSRYVEATTHGLSSVLDAVTAPLAGSPSASAAKRAEPRGGKKSKIPPKPPRPAKRPRRGGRSARKGRDASA